MSQTGEEKLDFIQNEFELEGVLFHGGYSPESVMATKNFQGRPDDVHLTTYPRTGTTWTQNILVGLCYGFDVLRESSSVFMRQNFPYMELVSISKGPGYQVANQIETKPRLLKNHLPAHLAPVEIFTEKRRNIVVVRNPKDTALSLNKFYQSATSLKAYSPAVEFEDFVDPFINGKVLYGSWWKWTKAWVNKCRQVWRFLIKVTNSWILSRMFFREMPENNLLVHYEDLQIDFNETVSQIEKFLGLKSLEEQQLAELRCLTSVDSMKSRYATGCHCIYSSES